MPCPRRLNYSLGFIYFYFCGMLSENKQANKKNQRQHVQLCWKPCTGRPNPARNLRRAERRLAARESDRKVLNGRGGGKMAAAVESSRGQEATGEEAASGNRGAAVTGGRSSPLVPSLGCHRPLPLPLAVCRRDTTSLRTPQRCSYGRRCLLPP